jgi:hypothetical protein
MDEGTIKSPVPECRRYWCFYLGCRYLVGSESGQSVKLLQNMVTTKLNTPPPSHTLSVYTVRLLGGGGGGGVRVREKVEGQQFTRGVENTSL